MPWPPSAPRLRPAPLTNLSKICGSASGANAGPVVGDAQRDAVRRRRRASTTTRVSGRRMHDRIADDIADRLLDQRGVGAHQRQIGGQVDLDALRARRAAARR